eukprot:scaffold4720_cov106-Isochrysis_galbana.AAC.1
MVHHGARVLVVCRVRLVGRRHEGLAPRSGARPSSSPWLAHATPASPRSGARSWRGGRAPPHPPPSAWTVCRCASASGGPAYGRLARPTPYSAGRRRRIVLPRHAASRPRRGRWARRRAGRRPPRAPAQSRRARS